MAKEYKNILVAVDGSEASKKSLLRGIDLAKIYNAKLIITHVIDTSAYSPTIVLNTNFEKAEEYASELLKGLEKIARDAGVDDVMVHLDYGSPKVKISKQFVKEFNLDLIVCGATGLSAVERFLIGSVSEYISRHAKVDVLIVKNQE